MVADPDGRIYAGASTGWGPASGRVYVLEAGGPEWQQLGDDRDLAAQIRALAYDTENVYVGTGDVYGEVFAIRYAGASDVGDEEPGEGSGLTGLQLIGNAPNPFRDETEIRYALPRSSSVSLTVFDSAGRVVRSLVDGPVSAGEHVVSWDGSDDDGRGLAAGVYFYRLSNGERRLTGRLTLAR